MKKTDSPSDWVNKGQSKEKLAFSFDYIRTNKIIDFNPTLLSEASHDDNQKIELLNMILSTGDSGKLYFTALRGAWNKRKYDRNNQGDNKQLIISNAAKSMLSELSSVKGKPKKFIIEELIALAYRYKNSSGQLIIPSEFMYSPITKVDKQIAELTRRLIYTENQRDAIKKDMLLHIESLLEDSCHYALLSTYFSDEKRQEILSREADGISLEKAERYKAIRTSVDAAENIPVRRRIAAQSQEVQDNVSKIFAPEQPDSKVRIGEYPPSIEPIEPVVSESTATTSKVME